MFDVKRKRVFLGISEGFAHPPSSNILSRNIVLFYLPHLFVLPSSYGTTTKSGLRQGTRWSTLTSRRFGRTRGNLWLRTRKRRTRAVLPHNRRKRAWPLARDVMSDGHRLLPVTRAEWPHRAAPVSVPVPSFYVLWSLSGGSGCLG